VPVEDGADKDPGLRVDEQRLLSDTLFLRLLVAGPLEHEALAAARLLHLLPAQVLDVQRFVLLSGAERIEGPLQAGPQSELLDRVAARLAGVRPLPGALDRQEGAAARRPDGPRRI